MTEVETKVKETQETPVQKEVKEETFDPREWSRRAAGAYKHTTLVDNVHLPEINRPKLIPVKEFFESNCEYFNETNGNEEQ